LYIVKMNWALLVDMAVDGSGTDQPGPNPPMPIAEDQEEMVTSGHGRHSA
jgi:hypothetical protein